MREIEVSIEEELEKAKKAYEDAIGGTVEPIVIDELRDKYGSLQVIKDEYGFFKITFKKYTMREQAIIQEVGVGIRGGVKTTGNSMIANPSIVNARSKSISYGIKNINPVIFDHRNEEVIANLDKTLSDWLYDWVEEFNTKNWKFRQTVG